VCGKNCRVVGCGVGLLMMSSREQAVVNVQGSFKLSRGTFRSTTGITCELHSQPHAYVTSKNPDIFQKVRQARLLRLLVSLASSFKCPRGAHYKLLPWSDHAHGCPARPRRSAVTARMVIEIFPTAHSPQHRPRYPRSPVFVTTPHDSFSCRST
jgi:hypothetical protein